MFSKTPRTKSPCTLLAVPAVVSLLLVSACSGDDDVTSPSGTVLAPSSSVDPGVSESATTTTPSSGTTGDTEAPTESIDPATSTPATTMLPATTTPASTSATTDSVESQATTAPTASDARLDVLEPRRGTWVVGDAGEIDVDVTPGGLVLVDVRAAPGWQTSVVEEAPDEAEVDFRRGNVEWKFEIEWENGVLEIEIDQDIDPAEPGRVDAGIAGSVEFDLGPDGLVLVAVNSEENWDAAVTQEAADEIEVLFVNGLARYEVDIEFDDGEIEVEVDFEVEGPFTP